MERNFNFLISAWGSLNFDNLQHFWAFQTYESKKFPTSFKLSRHSLMSSSLTKIYEKGVCTGKGEVTFENASEKSFWIEIQIFRFCLGELTLYDTIYIDNTKLLTSTWLIKYLCLTIHSIINSTHKASL